MSIVSKTTQQYSGFDPRLIPGCSLWLDATDSSTLTLSGSNVSQWSDKSGLGYSFTQSSPNQPTYSASGFGNRGSIVFNGSTSYLQSSTFGGLFGGEDTPMSFFIVMKFTDHTTPSIQYIFGVWTGTSGNGFYSPLHVDNSNNANKWRVARRDNTGTSLYPVSTGANIVSGTSYVNSTIFSGTTLNGFINGSTDTGFTNAGANVGTLGTSNTIASIGILIRSTIQYPFNGEIGEILVYQSSLVTSQRQQIEGYLADKWGLKSSFPTTHPFKTVFPYTRYFSPLDISGCQLWYDAADMSSIFSDTAGTTQITENGAVALWKDKSGNANDCSQATAGNRPTYNSTSFKNYPGISFTGSSSHRLTTTYIQTGAGGRNTFVVFYDISTNADPYGNPPVFMMSYGNPSSGGDWRCAFNGVNNYLGIDIRAGAKLMGTGTTSTLIRANRIIGMWGCPTGATVSTAYVYGNGINYTTTINSTNLTTAVNTTNGTGSVIAAGLSLALFATVVVSEIIHYNVELTTSQRQQIEGYLSDKWGIRANIPTTHPFKLYNPLTVAFTPVQIPGCALWLDAADMTTLTLSGSNITQWTDKVGGRNLTNRAGQATLSTMNGLGSVNFNGATQLVNTSFTAVSSVNYISWIAVGNVTNANLNYGQIVGTIYDATPPKTQNSLNFNVNTANLFYRITLGGTSYTANRAATNGTYIASSFTNLSTGNYGVVYNGTPSTVLTNGPITTTNDSAAVTLAIAYEFTPESYYTGTISEIILYTTAYTTAQRQQIEGYLAHKWGLVANLPASHPYKKFRN